jgi:hypothetical protein
MNKSNRIIKLIEEWVKSVMSINYGYLDIYKNPSSSDVIEISKTLGPEQALRLIIDIENKIIYIFPSDLLHEYAHRNLNIKGKWVNLEGRIKRGKIILFVYTYGSNLCYGSPVTSNDYFTDKEIAVNKLAIHCTYLSTNPVFDQESVYKLFKYELRNYYE